MKLRKIVIFILIIVSLLLWIILLKNSNITIMKEIKQDNTVPIVDNKNDDTDTNNIIVEKEEATDNKQNDNNTNVNTKTSNSSTNSNNTESNQNSYSQPKTNTTTNNNQVVENPKSDVEIAIEYQKLAGDPITYYNGHLISLDECRTIGDNLLVNQETTYVFQYECPFTDYESARVVGLIVGFKLNGVDYHKSYDEYKNMINN